jgi:high-affinity K+ transport system ATPase subunit B
MNRMTPYNGCRKKRARSKVTVRVAPYVCGPSREEAMFAPRESRPALLTRPLGFLTELFTNFAQTLARTRAATTHGKACRGATAFRLLTGPGRRVENLIAAHAAGQPFPVERVASTDLKAGDVIVVVAGEIIPADGEVISGAASVDESAITGESVAVIRGVGGDRSTVTGGTRVVSRCVVVRVTAALRHENSHFGND